MPRTQLEGSVVAESDKATWSRLCAGDPEALTAIYERHVDTVYNWIRRSDYEPGTELTLEVRAFDANGELIDPALMPNRPQTITVGAPGEQHPSKCGSGIEMH